MSESLKILFAKRGKTRGERERERSQISESLTLRTDRVTVGVV